MHLQAAAALKLKKTNLAGSKQCAFLNFSSSNNRDGPSFPFFHPTHGVNTSDMENDNKWVLSRMS